MATAIERTDRHIRQVSAKPRPTPKATPTIMPIPSGTTCEDALSKCDRAIAAKNKTIKLSTIAIDELGKQNGELKTEVNELRESNSAWYRNPFVILILGAAVGSLGVTFLKK